MAFGRKKSEVSEGGIHATALVVEAGSPIDNAPPIGKRGRGTVRILADAGSGPVYVARSFRLTPDRWLVRGMEIPVAIDPGNPDEFEVDWDAIPSIEERAAANDPVLADPHGAAAKVVEAMRSAGLMGPDTDALPGGLGQFIARSQEAERAATPDRFKEALEKAEQEPAPAGKERAVVLIATTTVSLVQDDSGPSYLSSSGKRRAVLSVHVPGRAPYAVFERKFKEPRKKADVSGAGLPALVSSTDPSVVEVLWDELPSLTDQLGQRIADKMGAAAAGMREEAEMRDEMADAVKRASANPPVAPPAPDVAAVPDLAPGMQETMAQSAKQALKFVKDPAQRKMLIDQYRALGITIEDD
jgi:hypothetical protein